MTMKELSSVFPALKALFEEPACDAGQLNEFVESLANEIENEPSSISFEFAPLVCFLLVDSQRQNVVSERAFKVLQNRARFAAMNSMSRAHVMSLLADRFSANNIRAVLLKGAAMDALVYPDEAFRLGCDVDILVDKENFDCMEEVLSGVADNCIKYPGRPAFTSFSIEKTFMVEHPLRVQIDMHWQITAPFVYHVDYEMLFNRCVVLPQHQSRFERLSNEDNLLQFSMHSFYDMRLFNKQTVDAYLLLKNEEVDWCALMDRARIYRAMLPLKCLLEGVRYAFGYVPPHEVRSDLALTGFRKWLAYRLLVCDSRMFSKPRIGFRIRQLVAQFILSGNVVGYLRYYFYYSGAKIRDFLGRSK